MEPRPDPQHPEPIPARRDDERPEPEVDGPAIDRDQRIDERAEEEARHESGLSALKQGIDPEAVEEPRAIEGPDDTFRAP